MKKYIVKLTTNTTELFIHHDSNGLYTITTDRKKAFIYTSKKQACQRSVYFQKYVISTETTAQIIEV